MEKSNCNIIPTMMDSQFRGSIWTILVLLTLPHVTCNMLCSSICNCKFIGAVICTGNTITDFPKQLPANTYLLHLDSTNISVINEQSLANQDLLLRFSLTRSHLHTIHPSAFHVAPQLKSVKLSSNDLSTLPARVFSSLTTLEQLHLNDNELETISSDIFEGLGGLLNLDLNKNKLRSLDSEIFDGLVNLTFLNLGRNLIKRLPPTIFHSLTNLIELNVYKNEIGVLEAGIFDKLINLQVLKIHENHITSIPPQVFWSLRNLKNLTMSSNRLQAIPEKSFYHMPQLIKLTIYKNPLLFLPDQLMGHMPYITEFFLYATNLSTVPGNLFANMSGLMQLNFNLNNKLRELPSDLFCCLPVLEKLSLKENDLHYLHPQLFSRLTTLGRLHLNDNRLQSLPENIFQGLRRVYSVDLKNNHLKTLPGDIFLSNAALKAVSLSGNPWNCTCSIRGIAKWIRHNEEVVLDRHDVMCHSPTYQLLRTVGSLHDEEFNFCDAPKVTPSYFSTNEPTEQFKTIPTSGQTSVVGSTTTPTPKILPTTQGATQKVTTLTTIPTTNPSALRTTILPTTLQTPTATLPNNKNLPIKETPSPLFYDVLVIEQGPEFVHHHRHRGWVSVWFLPSDMTMAGLLMFCHIVLVVIGFFLILGAMFYMYRLNKTINELKAECTDTPVEQNM